MIMIVKWRTNKRPNPNQPAVVYKMICPLSGDAVYIGYTIDFKKRVKTHLGGCGIGPFGKSKKAEFIKEMLDAGLTPTFEIIWNFATIPEAKEFEKLLINHLKPILNAK